MKYVYPTLNWIFGVLFLLTGLFSLVDSPMAGLCLIAAATLLLPPVRNFVYTRTNQTLPVNARAISIFVLLIAFVVFIGRFQDRKEQELAAQQARERAEKAAQIRKENIDYFNANREQIISAVEKAIAEKEYQSAISQSNKYLVSGDAELQRMNAQAKEELAAIQKTEKLLSELNGIPATEYEKKRNLYQKLVKLHPDNETYKQKVAFYSDKIEEEKQKQAAAEASAEARKKIIEEEKQKKAAAEARKKKIESQFSAWDGSHRNLEQLIKAAMNDPDSYKHVETVYWDRGDYLVVRTTYRGKNVFGGVVKNSVMAIVSIDGRVLKILDQ